MTLRRFYRLNQVPFYFTYPKLTTAARTPDVTRHGISLDLHGTFRLNQAWLLQ